MKGDFSNWYFNPNDNHSGVLEQQGKARLDRDGLVETQITTHWRDTAGRDIIGPGVAAIPADGADAFKVVEANVSDDSEQIFLTLLPGRAWADGLLIYLHSGEDRTISDNPTDSPTDSSTDNPNNNPNNNPKDTLSGNAENTKSALRVATYLTSPVQSPTAEISTIGEGIRDAVVLEVWREEINGFQQPDTLIEAALGGPDTTERLHTAMALRLYRLRPGETCRTIRNALKDNFENKGKLTASLQPTEVVASDCPIVAGGGYTGFEHALYRVEIARLDDGTPPSFKWSQFNGGLVGRGRFDAIAQKATITANFTAISTAGLDQFYLEVIEYSPLSSLSPGLGHWQVTYAALATLNNDRELELADPPRYGTFPSSTETLFFRLWNGIQEIGDFPAAATDPVELTSGIRLAFDTPTGSNYQAGDYWIFQVRAGDIGNPEVLINAQPPAGIRYHRVPLAVLNWNSDRAIRFDAGEIEDCRDIFNPLTNQRVCCTYTVGDGRSSYGDFDSIEEAIRHLPFSGGEICLLPGIHATNAQIENRRNLKIRGCDKQTLVVPRDREAPIFQIVDSECIVLEHMDLVTLGGSAITLRSTELAPDPDTGAKPLALKDITLHHNRFIACQQAIYAQGGSGIHIHHNLIRMLDKADAGVAIYLQADDSRIERNDLGVIPSPSLPPTDRPDDDDDVPNPVDPCAQLEAVYGNIPFFTAYVTQIWRVFLLFLPKDPFQAQGGIQIAGGSERVAITQNKINGGAGNGITLGTSLDNFLEEAIDPGSSEDSPTLTIEGNSIDTLVRFNGNPIAQITLQFERSDGSPLSAISDASGRLFVRAAPGTYQVSSLSPEYRVETVTREDRQEFGPLFQVDLVRSTLDLSDLLAFLYDISIENNSIYNMGLSGIGLPLNEIPDRLSGNQQISRQINAYAQILRLLGNPIVGLTITANRISDCFQAVLDADIRELVSRRGLGGISIALCTNVFIHHNHIENNGVTYTKPTCGIWITFGEEVDITHNTIIDNAPLASDPTDDLPAGKRGGIVVTASALSVLSFLLAATGATSRDNSRLSVVHRPAARIQDNNVDQPVGTALTLFSIGPATILNNQFNSERAGPTPIERYVGGVLILNIGGLNQAGSFIGSANSATDFNNLSARQPAQFQRESLFTLPNGHTLFNNNQTRTGVSNQSLVSQLIWTADDLGFDGNQSEALAEGIAIGSMRGVINTVLLAATLRASDSRLKEPLRSPKTHYQVSLLTLSTQMNTTSMNQGSHCIGTFNFAPGRNAIAKGNQVLDMTFCPRFNEEQDFED